MKKEFMAMRKCALFKNRSVEDIETLLGQVDFRVDEFVEGNVVLSPMQEADRMAIILSGSVDIQKIFPAGKIVIIERKECGDMIGESAMFSRIGYYPDTVVARKASKILFITRDELLKLFSSDKTILLEYLGYVANSTLLLRHKIGILSLDSIREKIAGYLIHDYRINESKVITLPFSKKDWAEYMDVSRTSLSRELKGLETEGILSFEKRTIRIRNIKMLEGILSL